MTWNDLIAELNKLTPEQREKPVTVYTPDAEVCFGNLFKKCELNTNIFMRSLNKGDPYILAEEV